MNLRLRLKAFYHRLVPQHVRAPVGYARRMLADALRRWLASPPLPPARLLPSIQVTPFLSEYIEVGRRSAAEVIEALAGAGLSPEAPGRVLDFGCGAARTLRFLRGTNWELFGCDINREAISWASEALPAIRFATNEAAPPLPYEAASFDAVVAISLFTHFNERQQEEWAAELGRTLKVGGVLLVSTLGPDGMKVLVPTAVPEKLPLLLRDGFAFVPGPGDFNANGAFHTGAGIMRFFAPHFEVISRTEHGVAGFQDLTVLRRKQASSRSRLIRDRRTQ